MAKDTSDGTFFKALSPTMSVVPSEKAMQADKLLREFLTAFGLNRAPKPQPDASAERPEDPNECTTLYFSEVEALLPELRKLVGAVQGIRENLGGPDLPGQEQWEEYKKQRADLIRRWNAAVEDKHCRDISRLCKFCGIPVFRRPAEQNPCCENCARTAGPTS